MPQGKIKTKTNLKPPAKKIRIDREKNKGITKKGKFDVKAKAGNKFQAQKFKKQVQIEINNRIEKDIKALAVKQGEGKKFRTIDTKKVEK